MRLKFLIVLLGLSLITIQSIIAQSIESDKALITSIINQMFEGMKAGDSSLVSKALSDDAKLQTVNYHKNQISLTHVDKLQFLEAIATPHREVWDERVGKFEVIIDDRFATVWAPYQFYRGENFSHCGINSFLLYQTDKGWKIFQITDTRRQTRCPK